MLSDRRRTSRVALLAALGLGLSSCAGFKTPNFLHLGGGGAPKSKLKGDRIPVLALNARLEPNAALKDVGYVIPAAQALADWPQPGGSPTHAVEHVIAAPDLAIAWRRRIGPPAGVRGHLTASPIYADGRLYVMDGQAAVSALDPADGRLIWRVDLAPRAKRREADREAYGGGIAFSDGLVVVTSGYRFVAALDARSGAVKWRQATEAPVHGAPTIAAGRIYAVDVEDQLLTFNLSEGAPGWNFQALEEPARMLIASSPAVDGETVIAPFASGELTALSAANGSELWSFVLSLTNRNNALSEIRDISGRPVIYRGDVLAGSHSGVFADIDLRTGQPRWSLPVSTTTTPWAAGDVVYVTSQAGEIVCISREAGQVYWIKDLNAGLRGKQRATWTSPVLVSNHLVTVSSKGELRALDPHDGKPVKSLNLRVKQGVTLTPVPVDGRLYVLADTAELIALR